MPLFALPCAGAVRLFISSLRVQHLFKVLLGCPRFGWVYGMPVPKAVCGAHGLREIWDAIHATALGFEV